VNPSVAVRAKSRAVLLPLRVILNNANRVGTNYYVTPAIRRTPVKRVRIEPGGIPSHASTSQIGKQILSGPTLVHCLGREPLMERALVMTQARCDRTGEAYVHRFGMEAPACWTMMEFKMGEPLAQSVDWVWRTSFSWSGGNGCFAEKAWSRVTDNPPRWQSLTEGSSEVLET